MANNFFDLVKDNFFNPFANGKGRLNYDLLQIINVNMSLDNLRVKKEEIVSWVKEYLDNCPVNIDDESYNSDLNVFAYNKVNYFISCGWLIEDNEGINIVYQLDENGIKLLEVMAKAIKDDTKALEFSGYVYNIYSNLYSAFKMDHATVLIEQIYEISTQLNTMLRGLNVTIKKYLTRLIEKNKDMPQHILKTLFLDYQKKVVLAAFNNFRSKDNPSKYKNTIQKTIDKLLTDSFLEQMIDNYIEVKCDKQNTDSNRLEAKNFFIEKLEYVQRQFDDIEEYIETLNSKNARYLNTTQARLNFLLNEENDIEGKIVSCLKKIGLVEEDKFEDDIFNIYTGFNLDENSLYKPISKRSKPKEINKIDNYQIDEEELERLFASYTLDNNYSVKSINEYVLNHLDSKESILASEFKISEFKDLIYIFLIQVYSQNYNIEYKIEYLNQNFTRYNYHIEDFKIERK